jgi:DNA-binding MarR family transcriptional regulator
MASRTGTTPPQPAIPFDAPNYLLHLLAAISRYRDVQLDQALKPLGLSVACYRALNAIVVFEPCQMLELAQFIGIDRTTMTRKVDQLVKDGLASRETPTMDRRLVVVTPTDKARRVITSARQIVFDTNQRVLDGVSERTQLTIIRAQQRMFANLAVEPRAIERMLSLRRAAPGAHDSDGTERR